MVGASDRAFFHFSEANQKGPRLRASRCARDDKSKAEIVKEKDRKQKQGLVRRARREDSLALAVKAPWKTDALAKGVAEEERCGYFLGDLEDQRCPRRKVHAQAKYCELHEGWQSAELARAGAPLPLNPMDMQLFLAKAIDQVIMGQKSDVQVRAVLMLVKLMVRNARWIFEE
jgi:hypothetical protein